jgi:addiction module RelE/StbE family toxin
LIWSPRALRDLDDACEFIARDSPKYAYLFAKRTVSLIETLPRQPLLGAVVPEYGRKDLRERHFQNYRIVYRVRGGDIEIVSITHAARLLPPAPTSG